MDRDRSLRKKALAERLKAEAEASRPAFSEELHARLCRALREGETPPAWPAEARLSRRRLAYAAAVLACLAAALLLAVWLGVAPRRGPDPRDTVPQLADGEEPLSGLNALVQITDETAQQAMRVDSTLLDQQWAYLDHDVRMAASALIDQLQLDFGRPSPQENPL